MNTMKNILIISSSPRRGGNSDTLCDEFMRGARDAGNTVEKIFLRDRNIGYCTGCGACVSTKKCVLKDDMAALLDKMDAAQVIVLASPVYFYTMSGQLKTFIDRCCARYTEFSDKEFYYILTAADASKSSVDKCVTEFQGFLDCLERPAVKGVIAGLGAWQVGEIKGNPAMQEAYTTGNAIR